MKRTIAVLLFLAVGVVAQTRIGSPVWLTGNGVAQTFSANPEVVRWLTVYALATNSGTHCSTTDMSQCPVTGGDNTLVLGSKGIPLLPGASYTYQVLPPSQPGYSLAQIFWLAAAGDKVAAVWAK